MRLIIDKHHLHKSTANDFIVSDQLSYQKARGLIMKFILDRGTEFDTIHVFEQPFTEWFNDIPELMELVTPRGLVLAKYPGQSIPENLGDDDIYNLGLLDAAFAPTEKNIFKHFFGLEQPQETITLPSLYQLAQCILKKHKWFEIKYLNDLWQTILSRLIDPDRLASNDLLKPIIDLDTEFADIISEGIYCAKNILYLENWLHEHARYFNERNILVKSLHQELMGSVAVKDLNPGLEKNIYRFIVRHINSGDHHISQISGYYPAEAEALTSLQVRLSLDEYQVLSEKFAGRLSYALQQSLYQLCKPEYVDPPVIDDSQSMADQLKLWQTWAVEKFIPYKFYYDQQSNIEDYVIRNIQTGASLYSDWLFNNYRFIRTNNNVLTNFDLPVLIREQMEDARCKVIWLILDGFPAYYTPALKGILQKYGLNHIEVKWSLATLPTITSLGIPLMLSGSYENDISTEFSNRQGLINSVFPDKGCSYTNKLNEFQKSLAAESDLCCLHTHEVDDMLHQPDSMFDTSRADKLEEILEKRIRGISEVIKETTDRKVKLIISTDHGATKCLSKGQNIKNSRLETAIKDNVRERCVALTGALTNEQFDPAEMYLLTKDISQNKDTWAIARGYKYFGRYDTGYRHGGLSPEETIVPVLCCEIQSVTDAQVQIRYIGVKDLKFGKTEKDFKLRVRNASLSGIELLEMSVAEDKNCIFALPLTIAAGATEIMQAAIKLPQKLQGDAKGGKLDLNLTISFRILGQQVTQQLKCAVNTEKDQFEDDFDF